jgi:hypothetical protein
MYCVKPVTSQSIFAMGTMIIHTLWHNILDDFDLRNPEEIKIRNMRRCQGQYSREYCLAMVEYSHK